LLSRNYYKLTESIYSHPTIYRTGADIVLVTYGKRNIEVIVIRLLIYLKFIYKKKQIVAESMSKKSNY